jgi:hypothetical protein
VGYVKGELGKAIVKGTNGWAYYYQGQPKSIKVNLKAVEKVFPNFDST